MAESTLSIAYADLVALVVRFLGYAEPLVNAQSDEVDFIIQAGIRQFYYPPAVDGVEPGYEWSFLRPKTTLNTVIGQSEYNLPDDLGRIVDSLYFAPDLYRRSIVQVSEARMFALQQSSSATGTPQYAACRFKPGTGTDGQRMQLVLWPVPDAIYVLNYRYEAYSGKISESAKYPLGGMRHSELISESCLAVAEIRANDERGIHWEQFSRLLAAGIAQDRKQGAKNFGQMGEPGAPVRGNEQGFYPVTYKGNTW